MCFLCATDDQLNNDPHLKPDGTSTQPYETNGGKWGSSGTMGTSGGTVTWSLVGSGWSDVTGASFFSGTTAALGTFLNFDYVAQLQRAFDAWASVANINFVQVADGGGNIGVGNSANIRIMGGYIDGSSNVLARAFLPLAGGTSAQGAAQGDMVFDSGELTFWDADSFFLVALHELGHSLGLLHENTNSAVMNPFYNPNLSGLLPDDINGIRAIYGAAGGGGRTIYTMTSGELNVDFSSSSNPVTVHGNALSNTITGTSKNDILSGNNGNDLLRGLQGNDVLNGGNGNDTLRGHAGNDQMSGGAGNDEMYGGNDNDRMNGGTGNDLMLGGSGTDFVNGAAGNDRLVGQGGDDTLVGGSGTDTALYGVARGDVTMLQFGGVVGILTATLGDDLLYGVEFASFRGTRVSTDAAADFDALSYIAGYADLMSAFGANGDRGFEHYIKHGHDRGRTVNFDAEQYLDNYDLLATNLGNSESAAARHFIQFGSREGRTDINGLEYIASYNDLMSAFGTNEARGLNHYVQHGRAAGRDASFDSLLYIASNADLIRGFGDKANLEDLGARHYINHGAAKGRDTDTFDPAAYLAKYDGLRATFGTDLDAATEHYIRFGFDEGRTV